MNEEFSPIIVPKDSFRCDILLNVIRQQLEDLDVYIGEEYYISCDNIPIQLNKKSRIKINTLADTFPPTCHILESNPINELLNSKYPEIVKMNEYTGLWYLIQNMTDNVMSVIKNLETLRNRHIVYMESDPKYVQVMSKTLGFKCSPSKIYPHTCFITKREDLKIISYRDFPMAICNFPSESVGDIKIPVAAGLMWIFINFCNYLKDKVDLTILNRIDYNQSNDFYSFPHLSEELSVKIKCSIKDFLESIEFQTFEDEDAAAKFHLENVFHKKSIVYGRSVAWIKDSLETSIDGEIFKFSGLNDDDPISMEPFEELTGKERLRVFLSDHNHNYHQDSLENYFSTQPPNIRILPYDRDSCMNYTSLAKLRSLGVLPYHNKQGLFSSNKQYVGTSDEWEKIEKSLKDSLQIVRSPYYKAATIVNIMSRNEDDLANIILNASSGYYIDLDSEEVYPPDMYHIKVVLKQGKSNILIYEYLDSETTDQNIYKAIRNGLFNVYGIRYSTFESIQSFNVKASEEGISNDYLKALMKKYIDKDI